MGVPGSESVGDADKNAAGILGMSVDEAIVFVYRTYYKSAAVDEIDEWLLICCSPNGWRTVGFHPHACRGVVPCGVEGIVVLFGRAELGQQSLAVLCVLSNNVVIRWTAKLGAETELVLELWRRSCQTRSLPSLMMMLSS